MLKKLLIALALLLVTAALLVVLALRDTPAVAARGDLHSVTSGARTLQYIDAGPLTGYPLVLLPSYGRSAADFNDLTRRLNEAGVRTLALQPAGVEGSDSLPAGALLDDHAADVAALVEHTLAGRAHTVLGHAFGNRMARAYASRQPAGLDRLILLSAGEESPPGDLPQTIFRALLAITPDAMRREAIARAFFAPANAVSEDWMRGWYPRAALAQAQALAGTPPEAWVAAGGHVPMTVLEAQFDAAAPDAGTALAARYPERVTLVPIAGAAHAMLPEQPVQVADAVLSALQPMLALHAASLGTAQPEAPVAAAAAGAIDRSRAELAAQERGNWLLHGRDYFEQRHSPLKQINQTTVSRLGLAWSFDDISNRALEATPIVVDGVMYVSGTWSLVYALDARTGRELWRFDPEVPRELAGRFCCDTVNRGVAVWGGRVFVGTLDGRLLALDAVSGEKVWETLTVDQALPYSITGAPRVVKGKVIIGNAGAEYGVRGYVSAYDAASGEQLWRFYTVPGNPADGFESEAMRMAAETWSGEWWKLGGGGTVWDHMAYDPELDLLYIGVGNGSPWNRRLRSPGGGDNLFLTSIVALRPDSGEYVWHYQVVPSESWDYTATQHMVLADIEWQGRSRKVLMQAPKSGFFMIIDRATGEFLSAEPFATVTWASAYDETGRPIENPGQDYAGGRALVRPGGGGAHNWQPMAYNPQRQLMFIPKMEAPFTYVEPAEFEPRIGWRNQGTDRSEAPPGNELMQRAIASRISSGYLLAWDVQRQQKAWEVPLPTAWNGGVLSTAGDLVFQGNGDRRLVAYAADSGQLLWETHTQSPVLAAPVTYEIDGEQYLTVAVGGGGAFGLMSGIKPPQGAARSRFLTFKLDASGTLPPLPAPAEIPPPPPRGDIREEQIARGSALFAENCAYCHGVGAVSGGTLPDLRRLQPVSHQFFQQIVYDGIYAGAGMPKFGELLSVENVDDIHAYLIDKAIEDDELRNTPRWLLPIKTAWYELLAWLIVLFLDASSASA